MATPQRPAAAPTARPATGRAAAPATVQQPRPPAPAATARQPAPRQPQRPQPAGELESMEQDEREQLGEGAGDGYGQDGGDGAGHADQADARQQAADGTAAAVQAGGPHPVIEMIVAQLLAALLKWLGMDEQEVKAAARAALDSAARE